LGHIFPASGEAVFCEGTEPAFAAFRLVSSGPSAGPWAAPVTEMRVGLFCRFFGPEDNAPAGLLQKVKAQGQRGVNKFPEKLANLFP
jgi:hypothetical protein